MATWKTPGRRIAKEKVASQLQSKVRVTSPKITFVQSDFARLSEHVRRASLRLTTSSLRFVIAFVLQLAEESTFKQVSGWLILFILHILSKEHFTVVLFKGAKALKQMLEQDFEIPQC